MPIVSRKMIFFVLSALLAGIGGLALRFDDDFGKSFWTELFWLVAAVILTSFVLETLLNRDAEERARDRDRFALRDLVTRTLRTVDQVVSDSDARVVAQDALLNKNDFANKAESVARMIDTSDIAHVDGRFYGEHYLDVSSGLRDLVAGYIRVFSESNEEMVSNSISLHDLANDWRYDPDVASDDRMRELELALVERPDDTHLQKDIGDLRTRRAKSCERVSLLAKRTAHEMARISRKATTKGCYG